MKKYRMTREDAKALGLDMCQIVGTAQHKTKWVARVMEHYRLTKDQAVEVYKEAQDQQASMFKFPRFVDALNAAAGRLDGIRSIPEAGKKDTLKRWNA